MPLFASEHERQAWYYERQEKERQEPLSSASKGDDSIFSHFEGLSSARVAATADLQGVLSSFDWELGGVMQFDRPDAFIVDQDLVRVSTDLCADWISRQFKCCGHSQSPLFSVHVSVRAWWGDASAWLQWAISVCR
jgi:hypothetical protein